MSVDPGTSPGERAELAEDAQPGTFIPGVGDGPGAGDLRIGGIEDGTAPASNGVLVAQGDDRGTPGRAEDVPASLRAFVRRYLESIRAAESRAADTDTPNGERR